jgi:hypothetical protein
MKNIKWWRLSVPVTLVGLVLPVATQGCDKLEEAGGDLAAQCGLVCPAEGLIEGKANISGIASIDSFFGAVVDFGSAAATVNANIRGQLDAMAASVGLEPGAASADISAAIKAKLAANVQGSIKIVAQEPKCQASVEVTASAAASCDAKVKPGSVDVKCGGSCTIDASAQADCSANGTLTCKGTAPSLKCEGKCSGSCSLDVAATCEGTCQGVCDGTCSVKDANGNCKGKCEGNCKGTCELSAGGSCKGKCEGSCEYTPPSGKCEATAEAKCTAKAGASVKCKGGCEGKVEPPEVSAECKATVDAKANASVECTPPSIDVQFQYSAAIEGNADAKAEFNAWISGFKAQFAGMLAATAKADILLEAGANIVANAQGAVKGAADAALSGDLKAKIGAGCAVAALGDVNTVVKGSVDGLNASLTAFADIGGAVGAK